MISFKECSSYFYDGLTAIISLSDVVTDIVVLISFYNANRITYFTISLVIIILAQVYIGILHFIRPIRF